MRFRFRKCRKQIIAAIRRSFLGRLCPEKGVDELLDCVEAVWKKHPDFHLVLGGFWEKGTEELQKKAKELEAQGIVECPGWVSAKQRTGLFEQKQYFCPADVV